MDVYVMKDGRRQGPYPLFRLTEMLADGTLTPQDLVWHEGLPGWQPLETAGSLKSVLRPTAPAEPAPEAESPPLRPLPPPLPAGPATAVVRQRKALAWRRFFARQIDITLLLVIVVATATLAGWTDLWSIHMVDSWALLFAPGLAGIISETLLLPRCGWTPGRLLLGLRVVDQNGQWPSRRTALRRSVMVWAGGLGFGLPASLILPMAQWAFAFWHFQQRGETLWDRSAGTRVVFQPLTIRHAAGIALATAAFASLNAWVWLREPLPSRLPAEERALILQLRHAAWDASAAPVPEKP